MKRISVTTVGLILAAMLLAASTALAADPPRAQLRDFACQRALDPANRNASVTAVMRPLAGTSRLAVKFDLLIRRGGGSEAPVRAGDLGVWISPANPTLGQLSGDVWNLEKQVVGLDVPASYRFRVTFRWSGAANRVMGTAVRYSSPCDQPELRPDLLIRSMTVTAIPGQPNHDLYTAVIANAGATAAGPFDVLFSPGDGSAPKTNVVARLDPNASVIETFVGPLCSAAGAAMVIADPSDRVDDLDLSNNSATAVCPTSGAG